MKLELNDDALEFGAVVREALGAAGGDGLVERAEREPGLGERLVGDPLAGLGVWDLDVRTSDEELEAAAAVCRSVGWWAAPGSVAERLARPRDIEVDALAVVGTVRPAAALYGSSLRWASVGLDGRRHLIEPRELLTTARKSAFVVDVELAPAGAEQATTAGLEDLTLGLVLPCWTLLGMLDRALAVTIGYVNERKQFGQTLSSFQSVQFQLTDAEVERVGVEELAKYALWSFANRHVAGGASRESALVDALTLRLAALEAADRVFRICHQLHGAIGFCDETFVSWLSRYSRPIRTLPLPVSGTRQALVERAGRAGISGLYARPLPAGTAQAGVTS